MLRLYGETKPLLWNDNEGTAVVPAAVGFFHSIVPALFPKPDSKIVSFKGAAA